MSDVTTNEQEMGLPEDQQDEQEVAVTLEPKKRYRKSKLRQLVEANDLHVGDAVPTEGLSVPTLYNWKKNGWVSKNFELTEVGLEES